MELLFIKPEEAIKKAIGNAMIDNLKIVSIGMSKRMQKDLAKQLMGKYSVLRNNKIKEMFGIKVVRAKTLSITTEIKCLNRI